MLQVRLHRAVGDLQLVFHLLDGGAAHHGEQHVGLALAQAAGARQVERTHGGELAAPCGLALLEGDAPGGGEVALGVEEVEEDRHKCGREQGERQHLGLRRLGEAAGVAQGAARQGGGEHAGPLHPEEHDGAQAVGAHHAAQHHEHEDDHRAVGCDGEEPGQALVPCGLQGDACHDACRHEGQEPLVHGMEVEPAVREQARGEHHAGGQQDAQVDGRAVRARVGGHHALHKREEGEQAHDLPGEAEAQACGAGELLGREARDGAPVAQGRNEREEGRYKQREARLVVRHHEDEELLQDEAGRIRQGEVGGAEAGVGLHPQQDGEPKGRAAPCGEREVGHARCGPEDVAGCHAQRERPHRCGGGAAQGRLVVKGADAPEEQRAGEHHCGAGDVEHVDAPQAAPKRQPRVGHGRLGEEDRDPRPEERHAQKRSRNGPHACRHPCCQLSHR